MAIVLFMLAVVFIGVAKNVAEASSRPNVLFLVVDDLRPKLGCYGETNMVTPNIDQLAAKSVKFEHAYVQQAVCSPSRTSFLTGRRPDTTRIFDLVHYFRNVSGNFTTLPEHFKNNGYVTQSVGKIFHPGSASGYTDDYPYSWTYPAYHATQNYSSKHCKGVDGKLYKDWAVCPVDLKTLHGGSLPDTENTDFTIEFLKNRSMDHKPFFIGMGYHKPHLPFEYPMEYLDLYPMSKIHLAPNPYYPPWLPEVAWSSYGELKNYEDIRALNISGPFSLVPLHYQYKLRQSYSAAASYTDAQVGRVLQALDQYGLADNTIITFHGDHGWQLGDHGEWCKHTNFDIATRIPMFVHVPGVTTKKAPPGENFPFHDALDKTLKFQPENLELGLVSDALVEAVDLYATVSELAGVDVPSTCPDNPFNIAFCTEGASLVPIIKNLTMTSANSDITGRLTSWKPAVFSQYPRERIAPGAPETPIMGYTMRTYEHRYTEWIAYNHTTFTADWSKVYARELYTYSSDPDEDVNVAEVPAFQDLTKSLSKQLRAGWRDALPVPAL
ncbi:iduronate 2-sulfatase-like [Littorina saxatilis]|uniref:Sulfatase N-terminal domain-containing protein n=1 Tax=Littorina saxatilis TaxID=31220 RepID=A0AAN9G791_9CAEN